MSQPSTLLTHDPREATFLDGSNCLEKLPVEQQVDVTGELEFAFAMDRDTSRVSWEGSRFAPLVVSVAINTAPPHCGGGLGLSYLVDDVDAVVDLLPPQDGVEVVQPVLQVVLPVAERDDDGDLEPAATTVLLSHWVALHRVVDEKKNLLNRLDNRGRTRTRTMFQSQRKPSDCGCAADEGETGDFSTVKCSIRRSETATHDCQSSRAEGVECRRRRGLVKEPPLPKEPARKSSIISAFQIQPDCPSLSQLTLFSNLYLEAQ